MGGCINFIGIICHCCINGLWLSMGSREDRESKRLEEGEAETGKENDREGRLQKKRKKKQRK